jgi:hypothetical protein
VKFVSEFLFVRCFIYVCVCSVYKFFFLFVCLFVKAYEFGLLDLIESGCNPYR